MKNGKKIALTVLIYSILCVGLFGLGVLFLDACGYALSSGPELEVFGDMFEGVVMIGGFLGLMSVVLLMASSIGLFKNRKWAISCLSWGLYLAYSFSISLFFVCFKTALFTKSYFLPFILPSFVIIALGIIIHKTGKTEQG